MTYRYEERKIKRERNKGKDRWKERERYQNMVLNLLR